MRKQVLCALVVLTVALMARTMYIVHAQTTTAAELRTQLASRYDIVALQQGIALVPKAANTRVRMIQVVNGAVTVDGDTLTASQLRDRLGADAPAIVQLTYLSAAEQRQLAAPDRSPPRSRRRARRRPRAQARRRPRRRRSHRRCRPRRPPVRWNAGRHRADRRRRREHRGERARRGQSGRDWWPGYSGRRGDG